MVCALMKVRGCYRTRWISDPRLCNKKRMEMCRWKTQYYRRIPLAICTIVLNNTDLTGEYEDRNFIVTRGDSRIAMTIARNEDTVKFGRECRFLIDDPESKEMLAYSLTKPLKVGSIYNGSGVYSFVLQEVVSTDDDNHELGIADYYKFFDKEDTDTGDVGEESGEPDTPSVIDPDNKTNDGRQVWL